MPNVAIYARISDAYEGQYLTEEGVQRQLKTCRTLCEARGWVVAEEYVDNNVSAFSGALRPRWEAMLKDLTDGRIEGIVCWDLDRFARRPADLERAIDIYDSRTDLVFATAQGDINLSSADGLTMARVMVAFANKSSRDTARRVAAYNEAKRRSGKNHGGGDVPWGYRKEGGRLIAIPERARMILDGVNRLLAEDTSYRRLVNEWNETDQKTYSGKPWTVNRMSRMFHNPRYTGKVVYKQDLVLDPVTGSVIDSEDDEIIPLETFYALQERAAARSGRSGQGRTPKTLLGGILYCTGCGFPMYGAPRRGSPGYQCSPAHGGCGRLSVKASYVEDLIVDLLLKALQEDLGKEGVAVVGSTSELSERISELEKDRATVLAHYRKNRNLGDVLLPEASQITEDIKRLRAERTAIERSNETPRRVRVDKETWDTFDVLEQRDLLLQYVESVWLTKANGRRLFDPRRLSVVWRSPATRDELSP